MSEVEYFQRPHGLSNFVATAYSTFQSSRSIIHLPVSNYYLQGWTANSFFTRPTSPRPFASRYIMLVSEGRRVSSLTRRVSVDSAVHFETPARPGSTAEAALVGNRRHARGAGFPTGPRLG